MKRLVLLAGLLLCTLPVAAQTETLVGDDFQSGGYGAPIWKVTTVAGKTTVMSGGRGAWVINRTYSLGGGGFSLVSDLETDEVSTDGKPLFLRMSYGGLELGYMHRTAKLVHLVFHLTMGGGTVELREHSPSKEEASDNFYALEPSLGVDANVTTWFRLGAGVSYLVPLGAELDPFDASDFGGPGAVLVLKFGKF